MNRGTVAVRRIDGGFALLCDCGATIEVTVGFHNDDDSPADPGTRRAAHQELAITCDACGSSHWLTITPSGASA